LDINEISLALITLLTDDQLAGKLGWQGRKRVEDELIDIAMDEKLAQILRKFLRS